MIRNRILQGDALIELKKLPNESIDLVVTSPPYYGLRNYNVDGQIGLEKTFEEYLEKMLKITGELKRVLKKTGQFWLNMGDCYASHSIGQGNVGGIEGKRRKQNKDYANSLGLRQKRNYPDKCLLMQPERLAIRMIDEQGWLLRNKVKWAKQVLIKKENKTIGSVMPTSIRDRFNESGEEFYFFVKSKKYYSNLDAVRIPNQVVGITDLRPAGIIRQALYSESKYHKEPNYGGQKFNLRVQDAERKAGQPGRFYSAHQRARITGTEKYSELQGIYKGKFSGMGKEAEKYGSPRARTERKRNTKLTSENYEGGLGMISPSKRATLQELDLKSLNHPLGKNIPTIWQINPKPHNFRHELGVDIDHFACFPEALIKIPIKFGCPKDGIVLDPFFGAGTTGVVAKKLGRDYIGIEINPDYIDIARKRLSKSEKPLF